MGGSFRKADVPLYYGVEDHVPEVLPELIHNLGVHFGAAVEHGDYEAFDSERRIDSVLDQANGLEQLAKAFQGKELRLDGDYHGVGGSQGIDGDQPEGRGAVDDDEIIVVTDRGDGFFQDGLPFISIQELDLGSYEVDVGWNQVQAAHLCLYEGVGSGDLADHHFVQSPFLVIVR